MDASSIIKLDWKSGLGVSGKSLRIPTRSGIYAYGIIRRCQGLPISVEWLYVGKAKNLRRRIASHDPRYETNPDLQEWLRCPPGGAELWVAEVDPTNLDQVEQQMIRAVNPTFNRNHRTNQQERKVLS
jgi:excinuclease UvrABC nuclease subunit